MYNKYVNLRCFCKILSIIYNEEIDGSIESKELFLQNHKIIYGMF